MLRDETESDRARTEWRDEMHRQLGDPLLNDLRRASLRPTTLKPLLQRIAPQADTARGGLEADDEYGGAEARPPAGLDATPALSSAQGCPRPRFSRHWGPPVAKVHMIRSVAKYSI